MPRLTPSGTPNRAPETNRRRRSYHAPSHTAKPTVACPYCEGKRLTKDGSRSTKHGPVQLYRCAFCNRRFTPRTTPHRTYPMRVIVETLSRYNRLQPLPQVLEGVRKKFGVKVPTSTARSWLVDFAAYLPFLRLRDAARSHVIPPHQAIVEHRLLHGQVYDFKYHRTKTDLLLTRHATNAKLEGLRSYLDSIPDACPHELFLKETPRASQAKHAFSVGDVRVTERHDNIAVESARFALQSVAKNKLRHEAVQEFMLVNDSATVAVEVPIVLTADDLHHYRSKLGFDVPLHLEPGDAYTGHIDVVQIRNGQVHILDYKPDAAHIKPIEQLMIYALALARRSHLLLYHFRCAWFDDRNYFELYPLHVVHRRGR
jgi:DNA-directed RNA polymerase subunit RPC12/RpoP